MWDLPGLGIERVSPALAVRFFTAEPPGKPLCGYYYMTLTPFAPHPQPPSPPLLPSLALLPVPSSLVSIIPGCVGPGEGIC